MPLLRNGQLSALSLILTLAGGSALGAPYETDAELQELLAAVPQSQHTLAQGIAQVAINGEVPTEAKLELKDGTLMLSVYTSEKGTEVLAEENVFKEYIGPAAEATWTSEIEVFEDPEHVARSAEYTTLIALSGTTLTEVLQKAEAEHGGTAIWIRPTVVDGEGVYEVQFAGDGTADVLRYSIEDGTNLDAQ